jgi:hypothetical protein
MRKNRKKPASSGRSAHQEPPLNKAGFEQPPQRTRDDSFSLFHYTTASGLIGIIETKSLWATHASFLNDTTECQLLSRLLTPQIEADFRRLVPELMECGAFRPEIQYALRGDALTTEAEKATSAILFKDLKNRLPIKKIIVGPHRDQENQMLAAKILLEKHGFDVQVVKADTAFRF